METDEMAARLSELKDAIQQWQESKKLEIQRSVANLKRIRTPTEEASENYLKTLESSIMGTLDDLVK